MTPVKPRYSFHIFSRKSNNNNIFIGNAKIIFWIFGFFNYLNTARFLEDMLKAYSSLLV